MTTGKTTALTRWTFVGKVMSLLFNMLSRSVIIFLPRSKHLLISWLQSPSAVILELPKIKSVTVSTVSPSICHEVMGPDAMIFVFQMLSFKPTFSLFPFHFQEALYFFFTFFHKGGVICITEVIDISPSNLDSSLCFIQPSVSHTFIQLLLFSDTLLVAEVCWGFEDSYSRSSSPLLRLAFLLNNSCYLLSVLDQGF